VIWGSITFAGVEIDDFVDGNINAKKYTDILKNNLWPVIIARHFLTSTENNCVFQDDSS